MSQFLYLERESIFHRLHPSVKIIGLFISFIPALSFNHPAHIGILWLVFLPFGISSGGLRLLYRLRGLFLAILFASFVLWTIFTPLGEEILWQAGRLKITKAGLLYAGGMSLRLGLMLYLGLIFIASTSIEEIYYGLTRLGLPFPASFALSLSFRLVPIFSESARTILEAQRCRGLKIEGGILNRLKSYLPIFIPVLFSALRKVDQLSIALESRGFGARVKRTSWIQFRFQKREGFFLFILLLLAGICLALRILGWGAVRF